MTSFLSTMQYASSHVHLIRGSWYRGLNHLNQYLDDAFPQPCLSSQSVSAVIGQVNHRSFRIAQESKIQEVTIWYSAQCVLCAVRCHCIFSGPGITYSAVQCSYISFSVLFQTKSSLVRKSYTQKFRTIFQTKSSLVWKEKK